MNTSRTSDGPQLRANPFLTKGRNSNREYEKGSILKEARKMCQVDRASTC